MVTDPATLDQAKLKRIRDLLEAEPVLDPPLQNPGPPPPGSSAALAGVNSPATQSSAAASTGVAGAIVVLMVWAVGLTNVTVPPDVVAALMVLVAAFVHWAVVRFAMDPENKSHGVVAEARRLRRRL